MRLPVSMMLGAGAVLLTAGCAQTGPTPAASAARVEAVYRAGQPAGTAQGQYAMGREALAVGRLDEALRRFGRALELDPSMVEARNGLGVALGQLGRHDEAVQAFEKVLAARPGAAHVLSNLGFAQLRAGRPEDARISLQRALELEPANRVARENLALLPEPGVPGDPRRTPSVALSVAVQRETPAAEAGRASTGSALVRLSPNLFELRPARPEATASTPKAPEPVAESGSRVPPAQSARPVSAATSESMSRSQGRVAASVDLPAAARVEVSNGVGMPGLAARTARRLRALGASVERIADYRFFGRDRTEIHYLAGYQDRAVALRSSLPVDTPVLEVERLHPGVDVRVVVGRDMTVGEVAGWFSGAEPGVSRSAAAAQPEPPVEVAAPVAAAASSSPVLDLASVEVEYGWRQI